MKPIETFKKYYQRENQELTKRINEFNESFIKEENPWLKENFEYFKELNSGGKNVRGTLVNLGYYLLKEEDSYSMPLALAYEVFQTAILVHDDIIDKDKTRRGKKTIHYQNQIRLKKNTNDLDEVNHMSNSIALCVGDYGLYLANQIISEAYTKDKNLGIVLNCFNETVLNTARGELLDVILPFKSKYTKISPKRLENSIQMIDLLKTSHYTIIGPLSCGLLLAGAKEKELEEITAFGEKVGIAFQIQDDILGIYSDEMGKVKGSDIKEFKQTVLYAHCLRTPYKNELLNYYGKEKCTKKTIQKVQEIFEKSGSKEYALSIMNTYYNDSIQVLENMNWIPEEKKNILKGFVEYLRIRNK